MRKSLAGDLVQLILPVVNEPFVILKPFRCRWKITNPSKSVTIQLYQYIYMK
jgi:hypothetical protein